MQFAFLILALVPFCLLSAFRNSLSVTRVPYPVQQVVQRRVERPYDVPVVERVNVPYPVEQVVERRKRRAPQRLFLFFHF